MCKKYAQIPPQDRSTDKKTKMLARKIVDKKCCVAPMSVTVVPQARFVTKSGSERVKNTETGFLRPFMDVKTETCF